MKYTTPDRLGEGGSARTPPEGFKGPFGVGFMCSTCGATVRNTEGAPNLHRRWHASLDRRGEGVEV